MRPDGGMLMRINALVKSTALVGFSQVLTSLCLFLLFPFLTKNLSTEEYGAWTLIIALVFLVSCLTRQGMDNAVNRFLPALSNERDIRHQFYTMFVLVSLLSMAAAALLFIISAPIAEHILEDASLQDAVAVAGVIALLQSLLLINLSYFRFREMMRAYAGISIVDNLGILILTVLFLSLGMGVYSPLLAYAISHGVCLIISMAAIIWDMGIVIPDMKKSWEFLRYGAPLAPSETTAWVTQSSDRYIIGFLLGVSAAGIYSAGYTIAAIMPALITPIQVVILPILSKQFDTGRMEEVEMYLSKAIEIYLLVAIPAVMGLSVLGQEILIHLSSTEYTDGAVVIAPVALGLLCYALFTLVINSSFLMKRTMNVLYINVFAAIINIGLNFVLIEYIGYLGAAIATLLAYATMLLLAFRSTRFDMHLSFQFTLLIKAFAAGLLMSVFVHMIPVSDLFSLLLTIMMGIIVYGLVLLLLMSRQERSSLLTLLVRDVEG